MRTSVISRSPKAVAALITVSAFAVLLAYSAYSTLRFAAADAMAQLGWIDTAIKLSPNNAKYYLQRGRPGDFETAVLLSPTSAAPHLRLAMLAEEQGNFDEAMRRLKMAGELDQGFAPRWATANYYFRRTQWPQFWHSARDAVAVYEGDLTALYKLSMHTGASGGEIYQRLSPTRTKAVRELVHLLLDERRVDEAVVPALALADAAKARDKDLLFGFCDLLVESDNAAAVARLAPALTRFGPAGGHCLEWRPIPVGGVSAIRLTDSVIQFELTGRQPDESPLARRYILVGRGRHYRLKYRVQNSNEDMLSGVGWVWNGKPAGLLGQEPIDLHVAPGQGEQLGELQLVAQRTAGRKRAEGGLEIDRLTLEPVVVE